MIHAFTPVQAIPAAEFIESSANRKHSVTKFTLFCGTVEHDADPARRLPFTMQECPMLRSILRNNVLMLALVVIAVVVAITS